MQGRHVWFYGYDLGGVRRSSDSGVPVCGSDLKADTGAFQPLSCEKLPDFGGTIQVFISCKTAKCLGRNTVQVLD